VPQSVYGLQDVSTFRFRLFHLLMLPVGSYLFQRIMADGHDSRFDKIKKSPSKFLIAFIAQATWVSLCLMPVLALNSIPHKLLSTLPVLGVTDVLGVGLWIGGFTLEVAADRQKNAWVQEKKEKKHDEDFLTRGLWAGRHGTRRNWIWKDIGVRNVSCKPSIRDIIVIEGQWCSTEREKV
jgi:steroid 5-alpha reductase family enzyme